MKADKVADEAKEDTPENLNKYPELTRKLLINRGITTEEEAERFLNPDYERDIHDPFLILSMDKAVDRILQAIDAKENIIIYGDYDCDGIPGSVIMHDFFKKIGYRNFENYIPHRHKEGYGLNIPAVEQFAQKGVTLLITVDCGITDVEEVARAGALGIDVIVTDHHLPQEILPAAFAILNSKQEGDTYPDNMLCGASVAWKLVSALLQKGSFDVPKGWEKWLLDMAGLSTIADMVPLKNENRVLAHYGLKVLRKSKRPGLLKLLRKMSVEQNHLTEDDIGFMIAPRINAASRMDIPMKAFHLLSTEDEVLAGELSDHLHKINDERKWTVANIMKETKTMLTHRELRSVIVIGNPKWQIGVLGIVAGNICEEYERPVFVWGREGSENIKGSCRSDGSVNVVELMTSVREELFINVGGHELAGGFSISHDNIHTLEDELALAYEKVSRAGNRTEELLIDAKLSLDEVTWNTYGEIERLAPFGIGNHKPTFLFENIRIESVRHFGKEKNHLGLDFKNSAGRNVSAIGFFMDKDAFPGVEVTVGEQITLVATLEKSLFRGRAELRLRIVEIRNV
ncbi:MAG: single-stranded-DNA-specific exonuclease RecJ [Patescibacteria group bacterium]|nr:single-stranded-DNA-specific exonuclease RecJ [Patescibacteria group bacterium]